MAQRVLHIIGANQPGGAETFFLRLYKALKDYPDPNIEVRCIVREGSWIAQQLDDYGFDYATAKFGNFWDRSTTKRIQTLIENWEPTVVQCWMNRAAKFTPKTPGVALVGRLGGYYNLKYYRRMDYLIANAPKIVDYILAQGWPAERVTLLPNFVPMPAADYQTIRADTRSRYQIPHHRKVVMMAGRLHENKGFDLALYALRLLPPDVHYLIAGSGRQLAALQAVVEADKLQDRVTFVPWTSHISPLAAAADVWLAPSRHEPLGNIVLDAWAHKVPIIASNVAGPASLITHDHNGLLIEPQNAKAMASAIERVLLDKMLAKSMAQHGLETFQTHYAQEVIVQKYIQFYQKISQPESQPA